MYQSTPGIMHIQITHHMWGETVRERSLSVTKKFTHWLRHIYTDAQLYIYPYESVVESWRASDQNCFRTTEKSQVVRTGKSEVLNPRNEERNDVKTPSALIALLGEWTPCVSLCLSTQLHACEMFYRLFNIHKSSLNTLYYKVCVSL